MSSCWVRRDASMFRDDWDLLTFRDGRNDVFTIEKDHQSSSKDIIENSLHHFFENERLQAFVSNGALKPTERETTSRINLVFCDKTEDLADMPLLKDVFLQLQDTNLLHSSIVRAISRRTSCNFIGFSHTWEHGTKGNQTAAVYNCRTPNTWPGDKALSVTFIPESMTTHATWFGCDLTPHNVHGYQLSHSELISQRLANFDGRLFHPMVLPLMFADLERNRQVDLVRNSRMLLPQKLINLKERGAGALGRPGNGAHQFSEKEPSTLTSLSSRFSQIKKWWDSRRRSSAAESLSEAPEQVHHKSSRQTYSSWGDRYSSATELWTDTAYIRDGLSAWRAQLSRMMEEVSRTRDPATAFGVRWDQSRIRHWQEASDRISDRLGELLDEYSHHIRECTCIMDGLQLANQIELSVIGQSDAQTNLRIARVNLEVARLARRDGSLMKSIAILGMIFLPATFLSSFFSMDFIQWGTMGADHGLPIALWIYLGGAVALTGMTCSVFYCCVLRQRHRALLDIEKSLEG